MIKKARLTGENFYKDYDLMRFLYEYDVDFNILTGCRDKFEIFLKEHMEYSEIIFSKIKEMNKEKKFSSIILIDEGRTFTDEELWDAEWVDITPKYRFSYAELDDTSLLSSLNNGDYCDHRVGNEKRIKTYAFEKELHFPVTRNISGLMNVWDEIFIDKNMKNWLEQSELKGFEIMPTYNRDRSVENGNTFQMSVKYTLQHHMEVESYRERKVCPTCGKEYYILGEEWPQPIYKRKYFNNMDYDVIKTKESLGYTFFVPHILISHNMYRFLKEHEQTEYLSMNIVKLID